MLNLNAVEQKHLILWQKIASFKFDEPRTKFRFADRLARENDWTKKYSLRVIEEYKKFVFLSAICPKPLTPSDPVDQVWHLHLTFTQSYWKDLCQDILQKEFHHNPTKGGKQEQKKFNAYYDYTFQQYSHYFGQDPPSDIWHDAKTRFSETNFVRVNKDKNLIIEKQNNYPVLMVLAILALMSIATLIWISPYFLLLLPILGLIGFGIVKIAFSNTSSSYGSQMNNNQDNGFSGCGGCSGSGCGSDCSGGGCGGCGGCGS